MQAFWYRLLTVDVVISGVHSGQACRNSHNRYNMVASQRMHVKRIEAFHSPYTIAVYFDSTVQLATKRR